MRLIATGLVLSQILCSTAIFAQSTGGTGGTTGATGGTPGSPNSPGTSGATSGGPFGTRLDAPGTNSAGTALPSGGAGTATDSAPLGTGDPMIDKHEKNVDQKIKSICKGC